MTALLARLNSRERARVIRSHTWAMMEVGHFWFAVDTYDGILVSVGVRIMGIWRIATLSV